MITTKDSVITSGTCIDLVVTAGVALIIARDTWASVVDYIAMIAESVPHVTMSMVVKIVLVYIGVILIITVARKETHSGE
jgi:hypothetical protein